MPIFYISLESGFSGDHVVVRVQGVTAFDKDRVGTKLLTGHAASFKWDLPEGVSAVEVEVELPRRRLTKRFQLQPATRFVAISLANGEITYRESTRPRGYM